MPDPDEKKKRRFWEVDPSIFKPGPRASKLRRYVIEPAKTLAKFAFYGLLVAYPLSLVILGITYGGLVFWGAFAGSVALIWILLWKTGYARNFEAWNPSLSKQLVGLSVAFLLAAGFFLGFTTAYFWIIPLIFGVITLILVYALKTDRV